MEKKKWLWKRKSSERSPGDSESSGSLSSYSERYCDDQDALRESPSNISGSLEVTSSALIGEEELKETMSSLTEKLSAALVNVGAKEELVKQHAKVAEEAVAGWEKAENEVSMLKQQLEAAVQQNLNLEARISHLDGALKECVRQFRQARDEQEKRISDAVMEKKREWEYNKTELEKQVLELQVQAVAPKNENSAVVDPKSVLMIKTLERENSFLKQELANRFKELEIMIFERDLSTQAAETASKLQLEAIKRVAKLEAECRRLLLNRKSSPSNNQKTYAASHMYADSLTDNQSDSGDRLNSADTDTFRANNVERNGSEPSCADSWASALILELDQFKNEKVWPKGIAARSVEIDMMDDFLEMERLVALPDTKSNTPFSSSESPSADSISMENPLKAEFDSMVLKIAELEKKLEKVEAEKIELEAALAESKESLEASDSKMADTEGKLEELQKMLAAAKEVNEFLEIQLIGMEAETRTMSANVQSLKTEIEKERSLSTELTNKCRELETGIQKANSVSEPKLKQENLAMAADKLAECQKTIASLGRQLESLATLEDFLLDTSNIPGLSSGTFISNRNMESNNSEAPRTPRDDDSHLENGISLESLSLSSLSAPSVNHITSAKSRNGFGKFLARSKSVIEVITGQE